MKVTIDSREIELRYSFRAFMLYENITDKPFQPTGKLSDFVILFYSTVMASDNDLNIDYEAFIDWLDEHPAELENFTSWLTGCINKNNNLASKKQQKEGKEPTSKN